LIETPTLPATTLADGCYNEMFKGCSSLCHLAIAYTGDFSATYFNDWMYGVSQNGAATYFGTDTTRGASAIPVGWSDVVDGYEVRKLGEKIGYVTYTAIGSAPTVTMEYSLDGGLTWEAFTASHPSAPFASSTDGTILLRAKSPTTQALGTSISSNYNRITPSSSIYELEFSGDIRYLLNKNPWNVTTIPQYAFAHTFDDSEGIVTLDFSAMT